jgi:hypothetical protein
MGVSPGWLASLLGIGATALLGLDVAAAESPGTRECRPACTGALPDCCSGVCTDLVDDPKNCGACGRNCLAEQKKCENGECVVRCTSPMVRRGNECVPDCPPCAADEVCTVYADEAKCCALTPSPGRPSRCGERCCAPTFRCCDDYYCCLSEFECCNGDCCPPGDICLSEPNLDGSHCCAPKDFCDNTCCVGGQACAPDGRCRGECVPACGHDEVCCGGTPGGTQESEVPTDGKGGGGGKGETVRVRSVTPGRCVPIADLCNGECCLEQERCGTSSRDPSQKVCCPGVAFCEGVCCAEGEGCVDGRCTPLQRDCEPACGPGQACCSDFKCCECCTGEGYACGRKVVQPYRGTKGEEIWICEPLEAPPARASWLDPNACRTPTKTNCKSTGREFGRHFNVNMVMCERTYRACGTVWTRSTGPVESRPNVCPPCELPFPEVCCDRWHEAERTKVPCDPSRDADCDGALNDLDDEPFAPSG